MTEKIRRLKRYIKHHSPKTPNQIMGMFIRLHKTYQFENEYDSFFKKSVSFEFLGYITKKEYSTLKRKKVFRKTHKSSSAYMSTQKNIFRISNHWGYLGKYKDKGKKCNIDILSKSMYKNHYGMSKKFDGVNMYLVGVCVKPNTHLTLT